VQFSDSDLSESSSGSEDDGTPQPPAVEIRNSGPTTKRSPRDAAIPKHHSAALDGGPSLHDRRPRAATLVSFMSMPSPPQQQAQLQQQGQQEEEADGAQCQTRTVAVPVRDIGFVSSPVTRSRKGLSLSLPSSSRPPSKLPTISLRDLSVVMSDLQEEIDRIDREQPEPKQLTPRVRAPLRYH